MAKLKYKFIENIYDAASGEAVYEGVSPKWIKTRNFGKKLLHKIVKVTRKEVDFHGKKVIVDIAGETGGWIERESNLSQDGECWVSGDAIVCDSASVSGDAVVSGNAEIGDFARIKDEATVSGSACIAEHGTVYGEGAVSGGDRVAVGGYAKVRGKISGNGKVSGRATVFSFCLIDGNGRVGGLAIVTGTVKDDAVVTGIVGIDGEVSGRANVVGNTIVFQDGAVKDDSIVTGGILNGEIGGSSFIGSEIAFRKNLIYTDGMPEDNVYDDIERSYNYGEIYGKDFRVFWRWAIDRLWNHEDGMIKTHGRELWIDCREEDGIELAESIGVEPKEDGILHLFVAPDLIVDLTDFKQEEIGYFTIAQDFVSKKSAPFQSGGKIEGESIILGNTFIDGYVGGEVVIIHDNSKVGGEVEGKRIIIGNNSIVDGTVKGDELNVNASLIYGTINVEGGMIEDGIHVLSDIEDSLVFETADIQGHFTIRNSLIEGTVLGTTFYGNELYQGKKLVVSGATIYGDEEFSIKGIDMESISGYTTDFWAVAHHRANRYRLFGGYGYFQKLSRLAKIRGKKYYQELKEAILRQQADNEKYQNYLKS